MKPDHITTFAVPADDSLKKRVSTLLRKTHVFILLLVAVAALFSSTLHADEKQHRILLLHSYHHGYLWTDEITKGLRDAVGSEHTEIYIEYMDSKRQHNPSLTSLMKQVLLHKQKLYGYDVVISADNNAFAFMQEYGQEIFGSTPHLFCGVNYFSEKKTPELVNTTGVSEQADLYGNLQLIRDLHPRSRRVVVLADNTATGKSIQQEMSNLEYWGKVHGLKIDLVTDFSFKELPQQLRRITPPDVILLTVLFRDKENAFLEYDDQTRLVTEHAQVPVYACWDFNLHRGVVGGYLTSGYQQGYTVGKIAQELFNGKSIGSIPVESDIPAQLVFDYTVVQRYNIDLSDYQGEARIVNKPLSIYDQYRKIFIRSVVIIIILFVALFIALWGLFRIHRAKKLVKNSEENLSTTLDSIGDGVITTDMHGCIIRMNPVAETLTGWKNNEAQGKKLEDVFTIVESETKQPAVNPVDKVFKEDTIMSLASNTILISRTGKEYHIADSAAPIKNTEDETNGVVLVFRDITEEYNLEVRLRQSQKMEAIGQLAGGIAHDFNNMLAGIMGAAEVLKTSLPPSDDGNRTFLKMIVDSSKRAADLSGKLLSFSRNQPSDTFPVNIHDVLNNTVSIIQNTVDKRIDLTLDLHAVRSTVLGDDSQLQNIFLNLGINAAHAMPDGGQLLFRTKTVELPQEYCRTSVFSLSPGSFLQIEVHDTGSGISPAYMDRIFDPFFTTKKRDKGTGLGLSTVYGVVRQSGGEIKVESVEGAGSVFYVLLPLAEVSDVSKEEIEKAVPGSGTVLVVDDEKVIRYTMKIMLNDLGYDVILAENGAEAVDIFQKTDKRIDLVLLDMIMPVMNGRDCFFQLRESNPDIPIILSSGFSDMNIIEELNAQGLNGILQKPFNISELSKRVAAILASTKNR